MKLVKTLSTLVGGAAIAAGVLANASPAQALTWTLNTWNLTDTGNSANDGTITGSFNFDSSTNTVTTNGSNPIVLTASSTNNLGFATGATYTFNGTPTYTSGTNDFSFVGTASAPFGVTNYTIAFAPASLLSNSASSGQSITVDTSGDALTAQLIATAGRTSTEYAAVNPVALVSAPVTGGTGVPFEVPGGATIPVFGSILALGAMRKFKKSSFVGNSVN